MSSLIDAQDLYKLYTDGQVQALNGVSLSMNHGDSVALTGPSGCGKSTLLNLLGTLDQPTSGSIRYEGLALGELGPLHLHRRHFLGFVFQFHHLVPVLTLRENVLAAVLPERSVTSTQREREANSLLDELGILHRADALASTLSGGERQRGAIARALINKPKLLIADEPTGNVDSHTTDLILSTLRAHTERNHGSLLIATHDPAVAEFCQQQIRMVDGSIQ